MDILVVESDIELGVLWCRHLERFGGSVQLVPDEATAIEALRFASFEVLVLDMATKNSSVLAPPCSSKKAIARASRLWSLRGTPLMEKPWPMEWTYQTTSPA